MSAAPQRRYRFASAGQWAAGLTSRVDADALARGALAPFAPYDERGELFASSGAFAPAAARDGSLWWRDGAGAVMCLAAGDEQAGRRGAPSVPGPVRRMAAHRANLWLAPGSLQCHDSEQLARRFIVDLDCDELIDFAADGRDGAWLLVTRSGTAFCVHIDCAGVETMRFAPAMQADPVQLTWLAKAARLVLLAAGGKQLYWFAPGQSAALMVQDLDSVRPCFTPAWLGSDTRSRIVLAGAEHAAYGGGHSVLTLDAGGAALGAMPLPQAPTGIHATRRWLLVTSADGLRRFPLAAGNGGGAETSCMFITPALQSPLNDNPRRWLRAEAFAALPPGTSLEISYAATSDPQVHEQALRIAAGGAAAAMRLRDHLGNWRANIVFQGSQQASAARSPLALALFDVPDPWLWVCVTLVAAPGAPMPRLERLDVLYPGQTLMQYLPAVYQRAEAEPGNFLRALVGVIETGTQELDQRIAAMGSMIDPQTAPVAWLDYVARWLGLPWDNALDEQQKRRLLARADVLASRRGTRAGLEALLGALLPGDPARYRVADLSERHGFARLGCASALPAILAGLPSSSMALGRKAILGKGRLACPGTPPDPVARLIGHVTVSITANAAERTAWEPWMETLLAAAMPVTARLALRWRSTAQRLLDDRLGDGLTLGAPSAPRLGTDAVTGLARLPATTTGLRLR